VKHNVGVEEIVNHVLQAWEATTGKKRRWHFFEKCCWTWIGQQGNDI